MPAPVRCKSSAASVADPHSGALYVDTSALVKLVVREVESDAIAREVSHWEWLAPSDIAPIEL